MSGLGRRQTDIPLFWEDGGVSERERPWRGGDRIRKREKREEECERVGRV